MDRDTKFSAPFRNILKESGVEPVLLPPRTATPERSRTLAPTPTDTPVDVREWMVRRLRTDTLDGSS